MIWTHYYKARNYRDVGHYHVLCTNAWTSPENYSKTWPKAQSDFAATPTRVTCPKCLDILIPKQEALLTKMKATRDAAKENTEGQI